VVEVSDDSSKIVKEPSYGNLQTFFQVAIKF